MKASIQPFVKLISLLVALLGLSVTLVGGVGLVLLLSTLGISLPEPTEKGAEAPKTLVETAKIQPLDDSTGMWRAPDLSELDDMPNGDEIKYGRDLIANTSEYLGPRGKVRAMSNGMNCQNCHLKAGTAPLGNNYSAVAANYPKVRARSGQSEDIQKRINDCLERSLNGQTLSRDSKEMNAMVAYIAWLGKEVPKGESPKGVGLYDVPILDRAADPVRGRSVYDTQCASCHQTDGQGIANADNSGYLYPPLWGENSYNSGAGLFRLSRFAGYVKANMPFGASYQRPLLTDQQAWDVAAYVNSLDRPQKDLSMDWPDKSKKPMDHPFGPFSDEFSEQQHKFGPFQPIKEAKAKFK
ncbi:hypothetical protein GCM10009119_40860 [Algoriphagus jejuensis]|uniref:Cytochrome c domain-containing protein n=1 Tax=Algoriphagus jejuensis TaxID=419934 RepID=A0ABP3YKJ2_9BACT